MGYVTFNIGDLSGSTCTKPLFISWTKLGREYLIGKRKNRKTGLTTTYFSLSDSDINYKISEPISSGFVPNISGIENSCINGTSSDEIRYNVNYQKEGLNIIKNYSIIIPKNNNSTQSCSINNLIYDILINNVSIFSVKPDYFTLLPSNNLNLSDLTTLQNNLKTNYVKSQYQTNTTFIYSYTVINNQIITITGLTILINNQPLTSVLTDNSAQICNNLIQSIITFNQIVIIDPNVIDSFNAGSVTLPNCN